MNPQNRKICFVISPIGEEDSDTRKRSDKVLKHIISTSVEQMGYEVIRADKISEPGIITTQIIQHIVDAPLVIADLTDHNPNVFYELALRHAIRKPLIQMIIKGEVIPFDVAATRIIQFDIQDLDSVEAAKNEIVAQIKSFETGKNEIDNPISVSLDLKVLRESGNPEQRSLADIVEAISELRTTVTSSEKGVPTKSLDELKSLIETMPSRVESRIDPDLRRRKKRFHPIMFEELMHMEVTENNPYLGFLMMIGFFKDDFPWIYEVGLETYRGLQSKKSIEEKKKLLYVFNQSIDTLGNPIIREVYGKSEDMYMFMKDARNFVNHFLSRFMDRVGLIT